MGCSDEAVKPTVVPSGVYYSFFFLYVRPAVFYLTIWSFFGGSANEKRCQRLDGKVPGDLPVQMV